jgi:hypothetical protein
LVQGLNILVDFGKCYIQNLSDTENIGEFLSFSSTAVGFGSPQYQSLGETILKMVIQCFNKQR